MTDEGVAARRVAIEAMERIERDGAYANLLLPKMLAESNLPDRDKGFVTELVYGSTRQKRALDHLVERFLLRDDVEPRVRAALRIGAYQLRYLHTPTHAAVSATVSAVPKRARGFTNAILRKVARDAESYEFPTPAIALSYPDWIHREINDAVGDRATAVLASMNQPATTHKRSDGYTQDLTSQRVIEALDLSEANVVVDLCAAPGGKATAAGGQLGDNGFVLGMELHPHRASLVGDAAALTKTSVHPVVADGTAAPLADRCCDAVIVDAPCSGLGSLRRRPDARWRINPSDVTALVDLQLQLLATAARIVKPGGQILYSVCTLTEPETLGVDETMAERYPNLTPEPFDAPWEPYGRGARLLPDTFAGDGMCAFRYRCGESR